MDDIKTAPTAPHRRPTREEMTERAKTLVAPWQGADIGKIRALESDIDGCGILSGKLEDH